MNNNRGNNRRRGRGNNRQQGGNQGNRIDSRARGNAPQLLEKYKKMAHDAHLNGDRVQEEYYLQFADHYFRVLADQRQRQEDQRQQRRDERGPDYDDYDNEPRSAQDGEATEDEDGDEGETRVRIEPEDNPFIRDKRPARSERQPSRKPRYEPNDERSDDDRDPGGLDPMSLPPPIATRSDDEGDEPEVAVEKPRRRTRKPKPVAEDDGGEALEAVS